MSSYMLRVIREKLENTFETDAVPTAADGILCRNLKLRNLEGDWQARDFVTGKDGSQGEDLFNPHCGVEYEVEAAPSGAAGSPPTYAALLKSSGLTEVISAGVVAAYSPTPKEQPYGSTTLHMLNGQVAQKVVGVRGSLSFTAETNRRPFFSFNRRGRYGAPEDFVKETHDFDTWGRALVASPENMFAFTLGGTKLCCRSFSLSDGRTPVVDKYMNCGGSDITGLNVTGRMQIKWPDLATKDILTQSKNGITEPLVFEIGKTAGQKVRISGPKVQIKFAGEENIDRDLGASLDLVFMPDQGDDDFLIEFL